jgi:hypothetical protein
MEPIYIKKQGEKMKLDSRQMCRFHIIDGSKIFIRIRLVSGPKKYYESTETLVNMLAPVYGVMESVEL